MRPPMGLTGIIVWMCLLIVCVSIIWATYTFAVPWIVDRLQEMIAPRPLSWTLGIIQESPAPRRVVYANHVEYVWE